MYLYFDINGNLKEVINYPVREGDVAVNTIFIYVEPENVTVSDGTYPLPERFTSAKIDFAAEDGTNLNPNGGNSISMTKITKQIPLDRNRDLYFFKYGYKYEFWSVELPSTASAEDGLVSASAFLYNLTEQRALNVFSFNVEASVGVLPDSTMSKAQYNYLYNRFAGYVPYSGATSNVNLGIHELYFADADGAAGLYIEHANLKLSSTDGNIILNPDGIAQYGSYEIATKHDLESYAQLGHIATFSGLNVENHDSEEITPYIHVYVVEDSHGFIFGNNLDADETYAQLPLTNTDEIIAYQSWVGSNEFNTFYAKTIKSSTSLSFASEGSSKNISFATGKSTDSPSTLRQFTLNTRLLTAGGGVVREISIPDKTGTMALTSDLPNKRVLATFDTDEFTIASGQTNYSVTGIQCTHISNFSDFEMVVITWDNCFAICPLPQSGAGRVCAAMWGADGEAHTIRIKYEFRSGGDLLDISLQDGFTPPSGHTATVIGYVITR